MGESIPTQDVDGVLRRRVYPPGQLGAWLELQRSMVRYRRFRHHLEYNAVDLETSPAPLERAASGQMFDSRFEGGNLALAVEGKAKNEFDLLMQTDTNSTGYTQWFFFSLRGLTGPVQLNIINYVPLSPAQELLVPLEEYPPTSFFPARMALPADSDRLLPQRPAARLERPLHAVVPDPARPGEPDVRVQPPSIPLPETPPTFISPAGRLRHPSALQDPGRQHSALPAGGVSRQALDRVPGSAASW